MERCFICDKPDVLTNLGLWVTKDGRHSIHFDCWIEAYRAGRIYTGPRLLPKRFAAPRSSGARPKRAAEQRSTAPMNTSNVPEGRTSEDSGEPPTFTP